MNDKEYWRSRSKEYEAAILSKCKKELEPELKKLFRESLSAIEEDIAALYGRYQSTTGLSYAEARKLLRGAEYSKWRLSLKEYVALSHIDSKLLQELQTLSMRSRISRLEKLYSETLIELQKLGEQYEGAVKDFLTTAYKERYYHGIYDLATAGKLEIPVTKVQPEKLENVLAIRWAGGNYSSRIWKNTEKLSQVLKSTLSQGLHRGLSVQKLSRELSQEMKGSYKNAERLVRTELNFVQNHAAKESLEAAGLEEYEFIAVLDHRTSQRCQALDGTIHLLEEYDVGTNAPPMHPRCRSTISAVVEGGKRAAKGKSVKVPADMKYPEFKAVYLDKSLQSRRDGGKIMAGLRSGNALTASEFEKTPPHVIGKLDDLSANAVAEELLRLERQIADEPEENAMIITTSGEIYHCAGGLNGIALKYFEELGEKLKGASVTHNHPVGSNNEYTFSTDDFSLFKQFELAALRGIDEKYVYELNRHSEDIDDLDWAELGTVQEDRHVAAMLEAMMEGYGYRRRERE